MSPFRRTFLLLSVSVLAACQLPSLEDRYSKKHRPRNAPASSTEEYIETDWEFALPGPDLRRDEALAYAVREVLVSLPPEQRVAIFTGLLPSEQVIGPWAPETEPSIPIAPRLCGDSGPLCAPVDTGENLIRLPAASVQPVAYVVAAKSHERLMQWTAATKIAVDVIPPISVLATVLGEMTFRLGSEELAAAALLLGRDVEKRIEAAKAKSGRPPSMTRVTGWLSAQRVAVLERAKEAATLCELYAMNWPVSRRWSLTSGFGYRVHPIYGTLRLHKGIDIAVPNGTEIKAPSAATVRKVKEDPRNGKWMELDHGNGITTVFCHASELKLEKGAKVNAGDVIALSGDTGVATGPHLHYQLHVAKQAVDPLRFRAASAESYFSESQATAAGGSM